MLSFNFYPFPELKTERLLLRRMQATDAPELFFLRSDPTVMRYIDREPAKAIKDAADFIDKINQEIDKNNNITWAIALLEQPDRMIGNITYWRFEREHDRGEIGYVLHPDFWRRGLMKEALRVVLDFGFDTMKMHSVEANINTGNKASGALLEASGFKKEAHFRENYFYNGQYLDSIIYSKLSTDPR